MNLLTLGLAKLVPLTIKQKPHAFTEITNNNISHEQLVIVITITVD